jgi:hypothetical protein
LQSFVDAEIGVALELGAFIGGNNELSEKGIAARSALEPIASNGRATGVELM